jgi:hypothetical protein
MNPQTPSKAKDFFLNLGATISLYTVVISLVNLLFTVINTKYPQINAYYGSPSIAWPVAILVIFTPVLILVMRVLGKQYLTEPVSTIHKWLTYLTVFIAGLVIAGDLVTVLYYFINGEELGTGFLLKVFVLLVVAGGIFGYYLSDIRGKLTGSRRQIWRIVSILVIVGSIVLGFAVLGSPRTQRLYKYDEAKVNDLANINSSVQSFYSQKAALPKDFNELTALNYYLIKTDSQTGKDYEYNVKGVNSYELCADFNTSSKPTEGRGNIAYPTYPYGTNWTHPAGHYCFQESATGGKLPM